MILDDCVQAGVSAPEAPGQSIVSTKRWALSRKGYAGRGAIGTRTPSNGGGLPFTVDRTRSAEHPIIASTTRGSVLYMERTFSRGTEGSNPACSASESVSVGSRGRCRPKSRLWRRSGRGLGREKGTSWLPPDFVWPCFSDWH